ncbi:aminodeoxychorismate synthase component I [Actinosynnema pretiosum]|uniref:aminodeoxychorismate synthase component I n=2 Tax=Actinosynnema pretiosum TaxID=42197 RepID=UPI0015A53086|nr:aminodeoxychorismate synthase component I [Actinosynnema pretiosum]
MRTLLIDNHDSYTYNLFHLLAGVVGAPPLVLSNDDPRWSTLDVDGFDAIVVSPGPGHPGRERDLGAARSIVAGASVPLLGVCLGHQAIGLLAGAPVVSAPRPRHGHLTSVQHDGLDLFDGVPQGFTAVRYHSLCVPSDALPAELVATAWAEDGVLMGLRHRSRPLWGVQFHPESIASEHGALLVENFVKLAEKVAADRGRDLRAAPWARSGGRGAGRPGAGTAPVRRAAARPWRVRHRELDHEVDTAAAFTALFAESAHSFWLDSSLVEEGLSRFSFLGAPQGPDGEVLVYDVDEGLRVHAGESSRDEPGTVFDALRERLRVPVLDRPELPFDLVGGYVGFFGYELKSDLGAPTRHRATTPDAAWMACTRLVVVDHERRRTHLLALSRSDDDGEQLAWLADAERRITDLRPPPRRAPEGGGGDPRPGLVRERPDYLADVEECRRQLRAGESYEICLTTRFALPAMPDPLAAYLAQRLANPAPYASFLRLPGVAVLSSSPERFLRVERDGHVESKPIKGTAARSADPDADRRLRAGLTDDPKVLAENLMIVDLLRNDLGRVCEIGSVRVPSYMRVESYATVHQLVSTVRGKLRADVDVIDCVRACFPGGSMTGAPKERTMEIIDRLETTPRGVYSGALGFLGLGGTADLNIVIRTAVATEDGVLIGAGGAIVLDSDPAAEFDEMLLKSLAPLRGLTDDLRPAPRRIP